MTDMALAPVRPDDQGPDPEGTGGPRRSPSRPRTVAGAPNPATQERVIDDDIIDPRGAVEAPLAEVIDLRQGDLSQERSGPAAKSPAARPGTKRSPPVIRLGLGWAVVMLVGIVFSPVLVGVALVPVAAVAALSAWRRLETPIAEPWWLAAACAGVAPLAAMAGPVAAVLAVVAGGIVLSLVTAREAEPSEKVRVGLCSLAPAAAAASLVLATRQSVTIGLALFIAVSLFDASNYVMGVGDTGGRLGALAGALSLAVLGVVLAGALVVPFSGASPWILCGVVAVTAPVAVGAGHRLVGSVKLPAWRRLDSLFLAGPLWVLVTGLLLNH
ncbi:MAG: hypothetical protein M3137_10630 [Actinomycetota bacterium]|nr:hypothetical protein [Actinomycetota bacterium]